MAITPDRRFRSSREMERPVIGRWKSPRGSAHRVFEELLSEHLDALYRTALRLCRGHVADAEDLLQDASLRAFDGFGTLRAPSSARGWLFSILIRTNLNRLRARARHPEDVAADMDDAAFERALAAWQPVRSPEDDAESSHVRAAGGGALDALADELRPVIVLVDVEGFRQREVADMLGIPEGTVASRLFRARCAVRAALGHLRPTASAKGRR